MSYQRMKNLCGDQLSGLTSNTKFLDPREIVSESDSQKSVDVKEEISNTTKNNYIPDETSKKNNSYCKTCG